ncbi:MAG: lipoyl(octanoyl) transferase LipB [Gammaproteobacteria bacterium]|nr:lipoyl(octanoyl) transferase LipB [Gammaproteobacteria bacterium]
MVRKLGRVMYEPTWHAMRAFTDERGADTLDEIWVLEHPPTYTLGMSCRAQPRRSDTDIPVIATDRGGQITYHGPGQIVIYMLVDLRRSQYGVRQFVSRLEQAVVRLMANFEIVADRREAAPGVYVDGRKIASVGLRVRRGACYHGLSLNVDMDLSPFDDIDPCGYPELRVTQLADLGVDRSPHEIAQQLIRELTTSLDYQRVIEERVFTAPHRHRRLLA